MYSPLHTAHRLSINSGFRTIIGFAIAVTAINAFADPTVSIADADFANEVDIDGDGFVRSMSLTWDPEVSTTTDTLTVFEKIFRRQVGAPSWTPIATTTPYSITGQTTSDMQSFALEGQSHGTYEYRIDIHRNGEGFPDDTWDPSDDSDLTNHAEETDAQDGVTIADASWTSQVDNDGDTYYRSMTLNWNPNLTEGSGTVSVFEKVYYKPSADSNYILITTTSPYPITGQSTSDTQSLDLTGHPHGTYDYRIEIFREGEITEDATRDAVNDTDLNDHKEEEADEDVKAVIVNVWWTDEVDNDNDGYKQSMTLNWDFDVAEGSGSLTAHARIYRRLNGVTTWTPIITTADFVITGQGSADVQQAPVSPGVRGIYEYRIDAFVDRDGVLTQDDTFVPSDDIDLDDHAEESAADEAAIIADAWWTNQVDGDSDGFYTEMTLNWNPNLVNGNGSMSVYEKVYWRPGAGADWTLLTTTTAHTINAQSSADAQFINVPAKAQGTYDYRIEVFRDGQVSFDAARDADNDSDLNDHKEELASTDTLAAIANAWWTDVVDNDGDGYAQSMTLNWDSNAAQGTATLSVSEKVYRRVMGSGSWTLIATTGNHDVTGQAAGDASSLPISPGSRETYEYQIEVYRVGQSNPDDTLDGGSDLDLAFHKEEPAPEDGATIVNAWWENRVDNDRDQYAQSMTLRWDANLVNGTGSLNVYEKIYWRPGAGGAWTLLATRPVHNISSQSVADAESYPVPAKSRGLYDYQIEVYRDGVNTPDATFGPGNDTDINDHKEETEVDDATAVITDAWWTEEVDQDGDGYFSSMNLNWNPDTSHPSASFTVFEKIYKKAAGTGIWMFQEQRPNRTLTGQGATDVITIARAPSSFGQYDYRIDIYRTDDPSTPDMQFDLLDDPDLAGHKEELPGTDPIIVIVDAWWSDQVDDDGDGYFTSMKLWWDADVPNGTGSYSVYEKVSWKASASATWEGSTQTSPHIITGVSSADVRFVPLAGNPFGTYDYRIELFREGHDIPDAVRDMTVDLELNDHKEETAAQDATALILDAWWTEQVDEDEDGYYKQMVLNWNAAIKNEAESLDVFYTIDRKSLGTFFWDPIETIDGITLIKDDPNTSFQFLLGQPFGAYDYRIRVTRTGQTTPDFMLDGVLDADLTGHPEEDFEGGTGSGIWRLYVPFFSDPTESLIDGAQPRTGRATVLYVQNLGNQTADLDITYQWRERDSTVFSTKQVFYDLAANGTIRWRPYQDESWELAGGFPVVQNSDEVAGSVVIESNQPVSGFVVSYDFDFHGFAAYTMPGSGSNALALPFVSDKGTSVNPGGGVKPTGTATFVGVQNLSDSSVALLSPNYWTANGVNQIAPEIPGLTQHPYEILPLAGVSWRPTIQDLAEGNVTGMRVRGSLDGRGPVLVTSNQQLAGRALRFDFISGEMAALTLPQVDNRTQVIVPFFSDSEFLKEEQIGIAAFIGVQNLSDNPVILDVEYRDAQFGNVQNLSTLPYVLPARAAVSWRPYAHDESEGVGQVVVGSAVRSGSAVISANGPVCGQVVSFDYDVFDRDGGAVQLQAMSAYETPVEGSTKLSAPFFSDNEKLKTDKSGKATFISVQNLSDTPVTIQIAYRDELGVLRNKNDRPDYTIAAHGAVSWRPFADDPWEGPATGQLVPSSTVKEGNIVVTALSGLIAGRVEIFDFDTGAKAAYTMPSATPPDVKK